MHLWTPALTTISYSDYSNTIIAKDDTVFLKDRLMWGEEWEANLRELQTALLDVITTGESTIRRMGKFLVAGKLP